MGTLCLNHYNLEGRGKEKDVLNIRIQEVEKQQLNVPQTLAQNS